MSQVQIMLSTFLGNWILGYSVSKVQLFPDVGKEPGMGGRGVCRPHLFLKSSIDCQGEVLMVCGSKEIMDSGGRRQPADS